MKQYNRFVIYTGYAESNSNSALLLEHNEGFDSPKEAMKHLKECIVAHIKAIRSEALKWCCKTNNNFPYCPICGNNLARLLSEPDDETVSSMTSSFRMGDLDGSADLWDVLEQNGWAQTHVYTKGEYTTTFIYEFDRYISGRQPMLVDCSVKMVVE